MYVCMYVCMYVYMHVCMYVKVTVTVEDVNSGLHVLKFPMPQWFIELMLHIPPRQSLRTFCGHNRGM